MIERYNDNKRANVKMCSICSLERTGCINVLPVVSRHCEALALLVKERSDAEK